MADAAADVGSELAAIMAASSISKVDMLVILSI